MNYSFVVCLIFCLFVVGIQAADKLVIDNFIGAQSVLVQQGISTNAEDFFQKSNDPNSDFIGDERDLGVFGANGDFGDFTVTSVGAGLLTLQVAEGMNGTCTYQLDGVDGSMNINPGGISQSLTVGGSWGVRMRMQTDVATKVRFTFYGNSNSVTAEIIEDIPIATTPQDFFFPYSTFTTQGGFNFDTTPMGALEIQINTQQLEDVDATVAFMSLYANDISGTAFVDCDNNGQQDPGNDPFANVNIVLNQNGQPIENQPTLVDGQFEFNVLPGTYEVCVDPVPSGFQLTTPGQDPCVDVTIPNGSPFDFTGIEFGFIEPLSFSSTPPDRTLNCANADTTTANTGTVVVQDCEPSTLDIQDVITNICTGDQIITRTFTAQDSQATIQYTQTITVQDNTNPVFAPFDTSNQNLNCGDSTSPANLGTPTATDDCSTPVVTFADTLPNGGCSDPINRTWTATDSCGNSAVITQFYTISDQIAPTFTTFPNDVTLDCSAGTAPANTGGQPTASDNCGGGVTITFLDSNPSGGCTETFTRTWFATDGCDNVAQQQQTITRIDTSAPILTVPALVQVNCGESTATSNTGVATATDDCNTPTVNFTDAPVSGTCPTILLRTWTASDGCSTDAVDTQTIQIVDTQAPTFTFFPSDVTGICGGSTQPSETGTPTAVDQTGCSGLDTIAFSDSISGDSCNFNILRTWSARDNCGNVDIETQSITLSDQVAPVFSDVPADTTADCDENTSVAQLGSPTAFDNCQNTPTSVSSTDQITNQNGCDLTISRTFTTSDVCGNDALVTQNIFVSDNSPPTISLPNDTTVVCTSSDGANVDPAVTGQAFATDNCDPSPSITFSDRETGSLSSGDCEITVLRTWISSDSCGNTSSDTQTIIIDNPNAPVVVAPPNDTIQCDETSDPANTGGQATVTSTCDPNLSVSFNDGALSGDCPSSFNREWTSTDACGRSDVATQVIQVTDSIPPVFTTFPDDVTVNCTQSTDPSFTGAPTVSDNCDINPTVTSSDSIVTGGFTTGFCPAPDTIRRTWTVCDSCQCTSNVQIITVQPTGEQECTPVDCTPQQCDPSNCPTTSCSCCQDAPAPCIATQCTAQLCIAQPCLPLPCTGCTSGSAVPSSGCVPKPCEPTIIYVDDDDLNSYRMETENQFARKVQLAEDNKTMPMTDSKKSAASSFTVFSAVLIALAGILAYLF